MPRGHSTDLISEIHILSYLLSFSSSGEKNSGFLKTRSRAVNAERAVGGCGMDFLDSAIAHTSSSSKQVEQKLLVQRMQQLLVEKHRSRLAELNRLVEAQSAEIEQLSEAFRDGGGPPEGWRPQCTPGGEPEEEDESESEEDEEPAEAGAQIELHRVLERPKWKM